MNKILVELEMIERIGNLGWTGNISNSSKISNSHLLHLLLCLGKMTRRHLQCATICKLQICRFMIQSNINVNIVKKVRRISMIRIDRIFFSLPYSLLPYVFLSYFFDTFKYHCMHPTVDINSDISKNTLEYINIYWKCITQHHQYNIIRTHETK